MLPPGIDDTTERAALTASRGDGDIDLPDIGGGEDHETPLRVSCFEALGVPGDTPRVEEGLHLGGEVGGNHMDEGAHGGQALGFARRGLAGADNEAVATCHE